MSETSAVMGSKPSFYFGLFGFLLLAPTAIAQPAATAQTSQPACTVTIGGSGAKTYQVPAPSGGDNVQIQCAIDQAIKDLQTGAAQSATVLLQPKARYRLEALPRYHNALSIKTSDLAKRNFSNFTFDGQGATLALAPATAGIYVNGCEDCVLENFALENDPSPMVEGTLISSTGSSVDVRITKGEVFTAETGYRPTVGKNANVAVFHVADDQAFPARHRYPARIPLILMRSASNPSSGIVRVEYDDRSRVPPGPPATTLISLIKPPLDTRKASEMAEVLKEAAVTRQRYPDYGPPFFTGTAVAALFMEQNKNLTLRNLGIADFPGQGIHADFNRGQLVFDGVRIVPRSPGGLRSVGAAGIVARNNQVGPRIINSLIQNVGDDAIVLPNLSFVAQSAKANTADLLAPGTALQSVSVTAGDRFNLIEPASGRSLGTFTAVSAVAVEMDGREYGYRVTFDRELPAGISRRDSSDPARFINLDQTNSGAIIRDNVIVGGERNGLLVGSSATVERNLFVGLGLWAIQYMPFIVSFKLATGVWSDFGPVTIRDNGAIDVSLGLLRTTETAAPRNYGLQVAGVTMANNTIIAAANNYVPFYAVRLDNAGFVPSTGMGNRLVVPDTINRSTGSQFIAGTGRQEAWTDAFPVLVRKPVAALWNEKCQTVSSSPVWKSLFEAAAPQACR